MISRQWKLLGLVALLAPIPLSAQALARRISKAGDGILRLTFAAREGVCGDGESIHTSSRNDDDDGCACNGPVRVSLTVAGGRVTGLQTRVGGHWKPGTATDLGEVAAADAADYFLTLAEGGNGEIGKKAILPAAIADSAVVWRRLLAIAKNERIDRSERREATFWVGQAAEEAATAGLDTHATTDQRYREVRESAVFALSQRPKDEGVPVLIRIAKTNRDPDIRRKALFWLGQSDDPRALAVFEEILGS